MAEVKTKLPVPKKNAAEHPGSFSTDLPFVLPGSVLQELDPALKLLP